MCDCNSKRPCCRCVYNGIMPFEEPCVQCASSDGDHPYFEEWDDMKERKEINGENNNTCGN